MSTRCNIIVNKIVNNESVFVAQLYHHCDGYFAGVGCDLNSFIFDMFVHTVWTPEVFVRELELHDFSSEYELEDDYVVPCPHGDIEYLYTITFDDENVTLESKHIKSGKTIKITYNI